MDLWQRLNLDVTRHKVVTLVGGGGKTTLLYALARGAAEGGKTVLCTTTTHMKKSPHLPWGTVSQAGHVGIDGKLTPGEDIASCAKRADVVLVEGDGAKMRPLKAPAAHEPVIPRESDAVLAVVGLSALGQTIGACCHRPEVVCALLGKGPEEPVTPRDVAVLLAHPQGGRKGIPAGACYRCVLNQADDYARQEAAREIIKELAEQGIFAAMTTFEEEERGDSCWCS